MSNQFTETYKSIIGAIRKGYPNSNMVFDLGHRDRPDLGMMAESDTQCYWYGVIGKIKPEYWERRAGTQQVLLDNRGVIAHLHKDAKNYYIEAIPLMFVTANRKDMSDDDLIALRKFIEEYCQPKALSQWARDVIVNTRHTRRAWAFNNNLHIFTLSLTIPQEDFEDLNVKGILESILFFKESVIGYEHWADVSSIITNDPTGRPLINSAHVTDTN